uniref:Uncharacterized protein n=1 Tax=Knipowitschia caucasica TaxID=637954 RepID=A0AAV2L2I3_KNICA
MLSIAVAASAHPCFDENDLEDAARVKLNNHLSQTGFPMQASDVPIKCPVDLYKTGSDLMGRSISPWAIVERKMPGHFPSTYYEAECLCQGCILPDEDGEPHETTCYNSRPVNQTRIFPEEGAV